MSHHSKKSYSLRLSVWGPLSVRCRDFEAGIAPPATLPRGGGAGGRQGRTVLSKGGPGPLPCTEHQCRSFHHKNKKKGRCLRTWRKHAHMNIDLATYTHQFVIINLTHSRFFLGGFLFFSLRLAFHGRGGRVSLLCVTGGATPYPGSKFSCSELFCHKFQLPGKSSQARVASFRTRRQRPCSRGGRGAGAASAAKRAAWGMRSLCQELVPGVRSPLAPTATGIARGGMSAYDFFYSAALSAFFSFPFKNRCASDREGARTHTHTHTHDPFQICAKIYRFHCSVCTAPHAWMSPTPSPSGTGTCAHCIYTPTDTHTRGGTHLDRTVEKNDSSLFTRNNTEMAGEGKEGGRGKERKRGGEERNADHHLKTREKWSPRGTE